MPWRGRAASWLGRTPHERGHPCLVAAQFGCGLCLRSLKRASWSGRWPPWGTLGWSVLGLGQVPPAEDPLSAMALLSVTLIGAGWVVVARLPWNGLNSLALRRRRAGGRCWPPVEPEPLAISSRPGGATATIRRPPRPWIGGIRWPSPPWPCLWTGACGPLWLRASGPIGGVHGPCGFIMLFNLSRRSPAWVEPMGS